MLINMNPFLNHLTVGYSQNDNLTVFPVAGTLSSGTFKDKVNGCLDRHFEVRKSNEVFLF
ncbi:hypothetical protein [Bacillus swezeyi]|uniref:hypothetical protein n=1 Tax=Bacillus swezeyi TaxID=1925020 RepID=UPI0027DE46F0|nr:hypothetical protein [Bacillus swezeyi]